jgi:hypothetical protein
MARFIGSLSHTARGDAPVLGRALEEVLEPVAGTAEVIAASRVK